MHCHKHEVETPGKTVWLYLYKRSDDDLEAACIELTPYEARQLAGDLMEKATDAECIARDHALESEEA